MHMAGIRFEPRTASLPTLGAFDPDQGLHWEPFKKKHLVRDDKLCKNKIVHEVYKNGTWLTP